MSADLYMLKDARRLLGRFVEAGTCDTDTIDERVNEACERLMPKSDTEFLKRVVVIRAGQDSFPLPRECDHIVAARVGNYGSRVFSKSYEFLSSGPGELRAWAPGSGIQDVVDKGDYALMYDIPPIQAFDECCTDRTLGEGVRLIAMSERAEDAGAEIELYGLDRLNMDIRTDRGSGLEPGETLKITQWSGGTEGTINVGSGWLSGDNVHITAEKYRQLVRWVKPVTKGYVSLYAVDPDTNKMFFLAKAHPDDTAPHWRRYRISNWPVDPDYYTKPAASCVYALVKLKFVRLQREDDVLPIQDMAALKNMLLAIRAENAGDMASAVNYEANATRIVSERMADQDSHAAAGPFVIDYECGMGAANRYNI